MSDGVTRHYAKAAILPAILRALQTDGKNLDRLKPNDLAPIDAFHIRGRQATLELAQLAALRPGLRVLDVGCGVGGSVRHLAFEHQCYAVGVDLTAEYVEAAAALAALVGLESMAQFVRGSAIDLPFASASFDVVWTEHAQMNIADKAAFYAEIQRVLVPGGRLVCHDVFQGPLEPVRFPVPWAQDASISFLATPKAARAAIEHAGLTITQWDDLTQRSVEWFDRRKAAGQAALGLHLLLGDSARTKGENVLANLRESRLAVVQARCEKR